MRKGEQGVRRREQRREKEQGDRRREQMGKKEQACREQGGRRKRNNREGDEEIRAEAAGGPRSNGRRSGGQAGARLRSLIALFTVSVRWKIRNYVFQIVDIFLEKGLVPSFSAPTISSVLAAF
ncbi:hypothetical protein ABEX25_06140 [Paenibacillus thiaminolyticus]|uniref:hypothetical protein n=1 Tax=Paenibacillus thiaminolyticus TaxID=49283 RepID=UPI003D2C23C9